MTEIESAKLLKKCDVGLLMGMEALDRAIPKTRNPEFSDILKEVYGQHKRIEEDIDKLESKLGIEKPMPNALLGGVSKIKSEIMFAIRQSDATLAKLMSDGTYMGINSLRKTINRTPFASSSVRDIAEEIIDIEDDFMIKIRQFL